MEAFLNTIRLLGTERHSTSSLPEEGGRTRRVLFVLEGILDVHGVSLLGESVRGAREYLFSLSLGEAFFDLPRNEEIPYLLELTPRGESRILEVSWEILEEQQDPDLQNWLASRGEKLLASFGEVLVKDVPFPQGNLDRLSREELERLPADRYAGPSDKEGFWLELRDGSALILGEEEMEPGKLYYTGEHLWMRSLQDCSFESSKGEDLRARGFFWDALEQNLKLDLKLLNLHSRLSLGDQWNLGETMKNLRKERFQEAFVSLGGVLFRKKEEAAVPLSPLFRLAARMGEEMNFRLPKIIHHPERVRTLEDLARAFNLRIRRITLEKGWERRDTLPFVGLLEEEKKEVLLLPRGGRCFIYFPEEDREEILRPEDAAKIALQAWGMYRPFPSGSMTRKDLFAFGLFRSWKELLYALGVAFGMGSLGLFVPMINGKIFQDIIPSAERGQIWQFFFLLVSLGITTALLRLSQQIALFRTESRMDHDVEMALWDRILRLRVTFFRRFSSGDLAGKALGLYNIRTFLGQSVRSLVPNAAFSLLYLGQMFYYDWKIALAALGCLLLLGLAMGISAYVQIRFQRRMVAVQNRLSGVVFQILTGLNKIRVAAAEEEVFAKWASLFSWQRILSYRARWAANLLSAFSALFPAFGAIAIFLVIMYFRMGYPDDMGNHEYQVGHFVSFWSAYGAMQGAFMGLISSVTVFLGVLPLYESLDPILREEPEASEARGDPGELRGNIDISAVTFRYHRDAPAIFQNFSLTVRGGEFLAIVGASGSGKSTLIRLLLGFEFPERGEIFFDNKPLKDMDLRKMRAQIGTVLQQGGIVAGDIYSNIVCSRSLTLDQAWEAARIAGLEEDIKAMPMGMHTMITEGANTLSGGQKQRLVIARAVANKPRILFFDEATSALDNRTQEAVARSLENLDATRIVVAHRLSTIRNADRIVVIHKGHIGEEGTFEELMEKRGFFYELSRRQMV